MKSNLSSCKTSTCLFYGISKQTIPLVFILSWVWQRGLRLHNAHQDNVWPFICDPKAATETSVHKPASQFIHPSYLQNSAMQQLSILYCFTLFELFTVMFDCVFHAWLTSTNPQQLTYLHADHFSKWYLSNDIYSDLKHQKDRSRSSHSPPSRSTMGRQGSKLVPVTGCSGGFKSTAEPL